MPSVQAPRNAKKRSPASYASKMQKKEQRRTALTYYMQHLDRFKDQYEMMNASNREQFERRLRSEGIPSLGKYLKTWLERKEKLIKMGLGNVRRIDKDEVQAMALGIPYKPFKPRY